MFALLLARSLPLSCISKESAQKLGKAGYSGLFLYDCLHDLPSEEAAANYRQLFETYNT